MAITRLNTSSLTGVTIPNTSINNASLNSVTALPSSVDVGKIGQVVYGQTGTQVSSSSNSYVDTGITATITPSATSSTIQIFVGIMGLQSAGASNARMDFQILRAGSGITTSGANMWDQSGNNTHRNGGFAMNFKDSPSSTSSLIYKVQFKAVEGTCEVQRDGNSGFSTITLIEVLA
jgi:hypothetical protein